MKKILKKGLIFCAIMFMVLKCDSYAEESDCKDIIEPTNGVGEVIEVNSSTIEDGSIEFDSPITEDSVDSSEATRSNVVINGITWQMRTDYIAVGVAYTSNDPNLSFRWLEYDVNSQVWRQISGWSSGNWAEWRSNCGDYWLHCEIKDSNNNVVSKTISFHYVAGNTQISGTYSNYTDEEDTTVLLGMSSTMTTGVKYQFKIYDVNNNSWTYLTNPSTVNWITWAAKTGTYWVHYELYTSDNRLADVRTYAFQSTEPVRRALLISNCGSTITDQRFYNDTIHMSNTMNNTSFYNIGFSSVDSINNATKDQVKNKIQTFFANATENDISYVFISCHGAPDGSLLIGNNSGFISTSELRTFLDNNIQGRVVLIVTSCYSGNLIENRGESEECREDWAELFVEAFCDDSRSGEFANSKYRVICAARSDEPSYGYEPTGTVPCDVWTMGAGWNYQIGTICSLYADANNDNKVTLNELYNYSNPLVSREHISHPVIYPSNSNFVIFGRY